MFVKVRLCMLWLLAGKVAVASDGVPLDDGGACLVLDPEGVPSFLDVTVQHIHLEDVALIHFRHSEENITFKHMARVTNESRMFTLDVGGTIVVGLHDPASHFVTFFVGKRQFKVTRRAGNVYTGREHICMDRQCSKVECEGDNEYTHCWTVETLYISKGCRAFARGLKWCVFDESDELILFGKGKLKPLYRRNRVVVYTKGALTKGIYFKDIDDDKCFVLLANVTADGYRLQLPLPQPPATTAPTTVATTPKAKPYADPSPERPCAQTAKWYFKMAMLSLIGPGITLTMTAIAGVTVLWIYFSVRKAHQKLAARIAEKWRAKAAQAEKQRQPTNSFRDEK